MKLHRQNSRKKRPASTFRLGVKKSACQRNSL